MKPIYSTTAIATGGGIATVRTTDNLINIEVKPPVEMGGPGGQFTNPEQLFAVGYSSCFGAALSYVAAKKGQQISPEVIAKVDVTMNGEGGFQFAVEMSVDIPGMSLLETEELIKEAHNVCPYSNATKNNIDTIIKVKGQNN